MGLCIEVDHSLVFLIELFAHRSHLPAFESVTLTERQRSAARMRSDAPPLRAHVFNEPPKPRPKTVSAGRRSRSARQSQGSWSIAWQRPHYVLIRHRGRSVERLRARAAPRRQSVAARVARRTPLQLEHLIRLRLFDDRVGKVRREGAHGVFFAVNQEGPLRGGQLLPSQQFRLVGVCREAVDGVDVGPDRNGLAEDVTCFSPSMIRRASVPAAA